MTSTGQSVSQMLKSKVWDSGGTKVLVVNHFRDLGSHVCMDDSRTAVTITQRIVKATAMARAGEVYFSKMEVVEGRTLLEVLEDG